jgi:hypothetical protein
MGKNNAHIGEPFEQRLKRFEDSPPYEIVSTVTNSIHNHLNNELAATFADPDNPQTSLMLLGIHAATLTLAYGLFGLDREEGYRAFLERFVDGDKLDTKFSTIAKQLHGWRNVLAHRWINRAGYSMEYDYEIPEGWKEENGVIVLNPRIYRDRYLAAFKAGSALYEPEKFLSSDQLDAAKKRLLKKFTGAA